MYDFIMATDEYGRRALDFVVELSELSNRSEINSHIEEEFNWYGLPYVTSLSISNYGGGPSDIIDINTRPQAYSEHYAKENLLFKDPVITAMRQTLTSLSWSDIRRNFGHSDSSVVIHGLRRS